MEPEEIPENFHYPITEISSEFSPIVSKEYYSKEIHKDSCLLKLNFKDYIDSTEVSVMYISAVYFGNNGLEKTIIDTITKNGSIDLIVQQTRLLKISFSKSCNPHIKSSIETNFKNSGSVKEITLDLIPIVKVKPDIITAPIIHQVRKPVIYAYSKENIDVSFTLKTDAKLTFTYPKYDKKWNTTVLASGGFEIDKSTYPYLFWEGEMNLNKHIEQPKYGSIVKKDSIVSFLETSLSQIGLNSTEKTDFITFWGPQMMQADNYYIQFLINEEYDAAIGSLEYSTPPNSEIRVFMIYSPNPDFTNLQAQTFTHTNRKGFTVVEWGGSEVLPSIYSQD